uniref:C2H2-type domain-containing protein n=1 Tax=Kalanchoe fedtschenkoi TaxID=63787 RepID=A0A7N0V2Z6_KALFE
MISLLSSNEACSFIIFTFSELHSPHLLALFFFMALFTFQQPAPKPNTNKKKWEKEKQNQQQPPLSSSWHQIKNLLHCKQTQVILPASGPAKAPVEKQSGSSKNNNGSSNYSCKSICRFGDVVHGNTRVVHRADNSPEGGSAGKESGPKKINGSARRVVGSGSVRSVGGGSCGPSGLQFRKLSGCYECHTVVDPSRYPVPRGTVCACPQCGEVFPKIESLEHHQAVRHAVSELGPEDSGRNIVEIIFKSSWLKKDTPICKIERILKVHNTNRTIQRFEDCRDAIKLRASASAKKNPRCAADGNELLRFHCTTLSCALGSRNSSSLCAAIPGCNICTLIRHGFRPSDGGGGVFTAAGSGRAHDGVEENEGQRAMIVCRVVAGRVRREGTAEPEEGGGGSGFDSVAGRAGSYSDLEELTVFNPRAILPCFVVIYKSTE